MGKSTINGYKWSFSIAMLVITRGYISIQVLMPSAGFFIWKLSELSDAAATDHLWILRRSRHTEIGNFWQGCSKLRRYKGGKLGKYRGNMTKKEPLARLSFVCNWIGATLFEVHSYPPFSDKPIYINIYPWRIHGAAIYGGMDPINIPHLC